jgi:hypothetical protein
VFPRGDAEMFASITEGRRWLPATCSLALHAVLMAGAIYYFDNAHQAVASMVARYSLRMIRLQPSSARPADREPPATAALAAGSTPAVSSDDLDAGPSVLRTPTNHLTVPRRFELPKLSTHASSAQILLQPDIPINIPLKADVRVPELLLWKPHPIPPPVPTGNILVAHREPEDPVRPNFPEPPALEPPDAAHMAELPSPGRAVNRSRLFSPPPAATTPLRNHASGENSAIPQLAPAQSTDANTLNVLSIPDIPLPPAGVFQLPPGNQAEPSGLASGGDKGQSANSAAPGAPGSPIRSLPPANAAGDSRISGSGRGLANPALDRGDPPSPAAANLASEAKRGFSPPGPEAVTTKAGLADGQAASAAAPDRSVAKVVLPADGRFSVRIESSGSETVAEAEGILSGKVVYTVYVRAGARKEWILQYCLPEAVERRLPATKAVEIEAPYPFMILRPDIAFGSDTDYLIVHGIVTALGRFGQLSYVLAPEEQTDKDLLLHSLQQWQLRPGTLDGQPIALEILLIIPRDTE